MSRNSIKTTIASVWLVAALVMGVALGATSGSGLFVMTALALLPPAVMWHFWQAPAQTLSESIRENRG